MPPRFCRASQNLLRFADTCILLASFFVAAKVFHYIRPAFAPSGLFYSSLLEELSPSRNFSQVGALTRLFWVLFLTSAITISVMNLLKGYDEFTRQSPTRLLINSLVAPVSGLAVVTVAFYAARFPGYSRVFVFTFIALSAMGIMGYRSLVHAIIMRRFRDGVYARETALLGPVDRLIPLTKSFAERIPQNERRIIGYFEIDDQASHGPQNLPDLPKLGTAGDVSEALIHKPIQDLVIVVPHTGARWLDAVLGACDYFRISVHIVPEQLISPDLVDLHILPTHFCTLPAVTLAPDEENGDGGGVYFWKRFIDVVGSASALVVLAPVFAAIAVAIKLTSPSLPVFHALDVVGYRGRRFKEYKFTTMIADAEKRQKSLMAQNEMSGPVFKIAKDPRVTPLGRFLRKYSLNELPQFWNVLVGDMSLVGPRPAGPHELARYDMWHKRKLSVRPGITCFWQVRGRNKISNFDDWVRMDLEYIQKRCTRLDLQILLRTAWVVLRGTGS